MNTNIVNYIKEQDKTFIYLALLLAFLPSFEAPKNLFIVLFLVSWLFVANREKNWGGRWQLIDTIFLLWVLGDIVAGVNAVLLHDQPANGSKDIIKFVLVGWAISRSSFNIQQIAILCMIAVITSVVPLGYAYLNCGGGSCVELNSVGHVNHTAIYLSIAYTLSLSLLVFNFAHISNKSKAMLTTTTIILAYVVIDTHSRASSGLISVITLASLFYAVFLYRNWYALTSMIMVPVLAIAVLIYNPPPVLNKFMTGSDMCFNCEGQAPSRQEIRNFSYYLFKLNPAFGIGFGNFANLGHEDIKHKVIEEQGFYDERKFMPAAHPHNVYYAYLVGGGLVMLLIFLWFWAYMIRIIYRTNKLSGEKWLIFSSVGVTAIVLIIGWVNTTLENEHALLTMFVLGLLISEDRKKNRESNCQV